MHESQYIQWSIKKIDGFLANRPRVLKVKDWLKEKNKSNHNQFFGIDSAMKGIPQGEISMIYGESKPRPAILFKIVNGKVVSEFVDLDKIKK